jgi:hypothetical protein
MYASASSSSCLGGRDPGAPVGLVPHMRVSSDTDTDRCPGQTLTVVVLLFFTPATVGTESDITFNGSGVWCPLKWRHGVSCEFKLCSGVLCVK